MPLKINTHFDLIFPCSDHEYEPIGQPIVATAQLRTETPLECATIKINEIAQTTTIITSKIVSSTEPIPTIEIRDVVPIDNIDVPQYETESPVRSITPFTDISRTEEIHTSQIDDSVIEELPLRREDRKKKSFIENAGEAKKNLQNKLSAQATSLRTKFKRTPKEDDNESPEKKSSRFTLKTTLKSSPKTSQVSPRERRKFKGPEFAKKLKSLHMPKIPKPDIKRPELPKFKMPERLRFNRSAPVKQSSMDDDQITEAAAAAEASEIAQKNLAKRDIDDEYGANEQAESETASKKRFEFFSRFRRHSKEESTGQGEFDADEHDIADKNTIPSSSNFSTHFATVPRTANKIKESIITKWNNRPSFKIHRRSNSDSLPRRLSQESGNEQPIRLAAKISIDDEEEALGILQTKEQIEMAKYDQENRAIHQISKDRESEFKSRKPKLVHQDSDLLSDESNREIDWEECERMRNTLLSQTKSMPLSNEEEQRRMCDRRRHDSNFSNEETQSSGSSGDRRRTGVIEDIDDDEFFLRQRGVSQDDVQISQYISSAIRQDLSSSPRNTLAYSDENFNHDIDRYSGRGRKFVDMETFSKSFESEYDNNNDNIDDFKYDDYLSRNRHIHDVDNISDRDVPVSSRYFPRDEDDNILFYQNEYMEGIEQPCIQVTNEYYDDSFSTQSVTDCNKTPPSVPKRKKKGAKNKKINNIVPNNEEEVNYKTNEIKENDVNNK